MAIPLIDKEEKTEEEPSIEIVQGRESPQIGESEEEVEGLGLEKESFARQLLKELVGVYIRLSNSGRKRGSDQRIRRQRNNSGIIGGSSLLDLPHTTSGILPDLIRCHSQSKILNLQKYATESRIPPQPETHPMTPQNHRPTHNRGPTKLTKFVRPVSLHENDLHSELSLDIKMGIGFCYQRIGDLRQIADQYETTNSVHRKRRHPAGNHQPQQINTEIAIKFELVVIFVIPVTLVGLSLAFLKKSA